MKKLLTLIIGCALTALLATGAAAQDMQKKPADAKPMEKSVEKKAPPKAAMTPRSDDEIKKCLEEKLANAPSMKDKKPSFTISNGKVTLTGEAKNGGQKGAATRMAKACGAKEVDNQMTMAAKPAAMKKGEEKK
jgi:osmotically-inducible protein OsmY